MKTITFYSAVLFLFLVSQVAFGQEDYQKKIEALKVEKQRIVEQEKEALKVEVRDINQRLEDGDISENEARILKEEVAKQRALNIENRVNSKVTLIISKLKIGNRYRINCTYKNQDGQIFWNGKMLKRMG